MEFLLITLCIIGVLVIYVVNRKQAERLERYNQKKEKENWYKNRLFHIIVTSINESDDSEYLRAAEEQRKLKEVGNNEVKVFTCVFRDDLGYHDESWEEYQARLVCFIKEKEAERHAEIRRIDPNYYRRWVLGKKMPESACLFLMVESDHSFVAVCIIGLVVAGGWLFDSLLTPSTRRKQAKKAKKENIISINGRSFKELPPPPKQ